MKSLPFVCSLLFALPLVAQDGSDAALGRRLVAVDPAEPTLTVVAQPDAMVFVVGGQVGRFCGVVAIAPSPQLVHSLVGLPPLLAYGEVIAYGAGDAHGFAFDGPLAPFGLGVAWYAQGIVIDEHGLRASAVATIPSPIIAL